MGLKLPDVSLTGEENPEKKTSSRKLVPTGNRTRARCVWELLPHASYSPHMSPLDFDLFPKLKRPMPGQCLSSMEEPSTYGTRTVAMRGETIRAS